MQLSRDKILRMTGTNTNTTGGTTISGGGGGGQGGAAEYADRAGTADNLSENSSDWQKILRKDITDTAAEVITFAKGIISTLESYFNGGITVAGTTETTYLETADDASIGGDLAVSGGAEILGDMTVGGDATIEENAEVVGDLTVDGASDVAGYSHVGGDIEVDGSGSIGGSLTVTNKVQAAEVEASKFNTPGYTMAEGWIGNGFVLQLDANRRAAMQIDDLTVLGKMLVNTLNVREVSYIGGTYLLTPAASTLIKAVPLYSTTTPEDTLNWTTVAPTEDADIVGYRLMWKADDGTTYTMNYWHLGDQAFCQTFNITEPGTYTDVENKRYYRLVVNVGTDEETNMHFADVADVDTVYLYDGDGVQLMNLDGGTDFVGREGATGSVPGEGDKVVCLGSQLDTDRQGAIQLSSESPANMGIYDGIRDFRALTNYEIHYMSKNRVTLSSNRFSWKAADGNNNPPSVYRGTWTSGCISSWGDEWTYEGYNWICLFVNGTTPEAPGTTAANWQMNKHGQEPIASIKADMGQIKLSVDTGWRNFLLTPKAVDATRESSYTTTYETVNDAMFGPCIRVGYTGNGNFQMRFRFDNDNRAMLSGKTVTIFAIVRGNALPSGATVGQILIGTAGKTALMSCQMKTVSGVLAVTSVASSVLGSVTGFEAAGGSWFKVWATFNAGTIFSASGIYYGINSINGATWDVYALGIVQSEACPSVYGIMTNAGLVHTGIDITTGAIDLIADNVTIRNNAGTEIMSTDANGTTTLNDMVVRGTMMYKRVYQYDTARLNVDAVYMWDGDRSVVSTIKLAYDDLVIFGAKRNSVIGVYLPPASACPGAVFELHDLTWNNGASDPTPVGIYVQDDIDDGPTWVEYGGVTYYTNRFVLPFVVESQYMSYEYFGLTATTHLKLVATQCPVWGSAQSTTTYVWMLLET